MARYQRVISKDVTCPTCGAEPGQLCNEGSFDPPYVQKVALNRGHLDRTKEVLIEDGDE